MYLRFNLDLAPITTFAMKLNCTV